MTTYQLVVWILILAAFAVACDAMSRFFQSPGCPFCGGRTEHETDCPVNK